MEDKYEQLRKKYEQIIPDQLVNELMRSSPSNYYKKKNLNTIIIILFHRSEYQYNRADLLHLFDDVSSFHEGGDQMILLMHLLLRSL